MPYLSQTFFELVLPGGDCSSSSSRISALTRGNKNAGNVLIRAGNLNVWNDARINVSSEQSKVDIGIESLVTGNAGILQINASKIDVDNKGAITAATFMGEGGDIFLYSVDLRLRNSNITTSVDGIGNGGNINITANTVELLESDIVANVLEGCGGDIKIAATVSFVSINTSITTSSENGIDGNVRIDVREINIDKGVIPASPE